VRGRDPDRFKTAKIERIVNQIRRLKVDELVLLNRRLKELGLPPLPPVETAGVPVRPKGTPPSLSAAAVAEIKED
jgi:hypothetical protein